jgi:small redox-active disulfide protein 2
MDIKVLGPGCKNCVTLDKIAHEVVSDLGITATFEKVEDYAAIASYGVMSSPALVVNGKVLLSGRVPTPNHLKEMFREAGLV